jgi:capsular exopolysaccharide synthesis family protein
MKNRLEMEYLEREPEREFDLMDYWRVIVKRKGILFTFAGTILLLVGIYSFTAAPKYKPEATLLVGEETSKILSIEDQFGFAGYRSTIKEQIFINTQLQLLKSASLGERVARKLDLLAREEFGAGKEKKKSITQKIKDLVTFQWLRSKKDEGLENAADPYEEIVEDLQKAVDVSQIRDTKILKVSYTSKHPRLATEIVNTWADEFIMFSIEKRYETTQQASDFLSEQINQLREDLAAKERELQRYGKEKEILYLSDQENAALSKFEELDRAYTQAQIERVRTWANYDALRNSSVDSLPRTVENRIIQDLEEQYTNMKNEYRELSKELKPDHPRMVRIQSRMDSMREELQGEINKAVELARTEYQEAYNKELSMKRLLDGQRNEVARMSSDAILYNSLKIEAENIQSHLDSLLKMQTETQVSARLGGLKTSNISIVDKAKVPKDPVSPKKKLNLVLALLMGLFGGVGLCFVFEYLDNTVKGPEDVEKLAGLPSLGVVPYLSPEGTKKKRTGRRSGYKYAYSYTEENPGEEEMPEIKDIELVNHLYPKFSIAEDYRTIRTSILLSHADEPPKTIAFTSAMPTEGKTATVANMAVAFAQLGKKVLIVDTDLRMPRLHKLFKVDNAKGLSGYLTGKVKVEEAIQQTAVENIWLLPSGYVPPNTAELLDSKKMRILVEGLIKGFDVVLFDTPPVLSVVDSLVVGSLAGSVIVVVQPEKTTKKPFLKAVEAMRRAKARIIGVVFNQAKIRKSDYYYMDYYYYYRKDYTGEGRREGPH